MPKYSIDAPGCRDHHGNVDARLNHDITKFVGLILPLLESDPMRHTIALTVSHVLMRVPGSTGDPPVLLTVHRGERLTGAAICTPPRGLIVSALRRKVPVWRSGGSHSSTRACPAQSGPATLRKCSPGHGRRRPARRCTSRWHSGCTLCTGSHHRSVCPARCGRPASTTSNCWRSGGRTSPTRRPGGLRGPGSAAQQTRQARAAGTMALLWEVAGPRGVGIRDCTVGRNVADRTGVHAAGASRARIWQRGDSGRRRLGPAGRCEGRGAVH